ncbi:MAG: chemotaxis protein CheW [Spirochaetaceae bacterium]|jgi:purine-binding chemotaxis protein CheW|nr:chemotaxis protein CheW [Spirochaetaceae bacterium]
MAVIKDLATANAELQQQKERVDTVDFKMVTFSLAGKDYGVDIMNVKEIAKADKFTYVPNAVSFVRGVYNLRGDIIPIIDLRSFFHMKSERRVDGQENMLILHLDDRVYGAIVDKIDKVVGINSETIQPPHPMFGEINIKFITGVVEKDGYLYIILDVMRMFSQKEEEKQKPRTAIQDAGGDNYYVPPAAAAPEQAEEEKRPVVSDTTIGFIKESLTALKQFFVSPINLDWFNRQFAEWSSTRTDADLQIKNATEADEYLADFPSPYTGEFWSDAYAAQVKDILPDMNSNNIQVWNLGCGRGYETFSFACILKLRYPDGHIKVWANDNDIMAIADAPNMTFDLNKVPEYCRSFMVKGRNGYTFNQVIKDSIVFEYHDVLNNNVLPDLNIILARDLISFFPLDSQERLIVDCTERLKDKGVVILGANEVLSGDNWESIGREPISVFLYSKS